MSHYISYPLRFLLTFNLNEMLIPMKDQMQVLISLAYFYSKLEIKEYTVNKINTLIINITITGIISFFLNLFLTTFGLLLRKNPIHDNIIYMVPCKNINTQKDYACMGRFYTIRKYYIHISKQDRSQ